MATKTASPKTRKPKVNNFVLVLEQFLEKHNLTADSTPEQLNEHAPKLDVLLPDWMARRCVKVALARDTDNRRSFSEERIEALLPDKRKGKLTIEERAKYCAKISDAMDIFAHHLDLGPKNDYDNEIVASGSRQSQFRIKLAEGGVSPEIINTYAKDPKLIQESNKIQKKQTKKRMANPDRIPIHFSSARVLKRIQNMDVSKIPSKEDLADVIVMLSMRPAEVRSLQIIYYEPDSLNVPVWYKEGYSWYCTGYLKSRGEKKKNPEPRPFLSMEKNPERARELLTWIQDAIKAKKLSDPIFTKNGTRNAWPFNEFLKQEPYRTIPKNLRDYGSKHASRIHGGKKPTPQHLKLLSRIAMRQESDRLDAGDNYAIGNTESEESDSEPETSNSSNPQTQASSSSQTIEMDSMLAEIDAMLAEIQK
ncbi:highly derived d5-like helicase-primase: PROVISIONAL [Gigaspora margarita]|uniref:Highly derived d5-like helicase-primase: PROVISIONAL n=1 Tax=Gigaspora margarita TaxID=4874 RepID=A0A8H3X4Y6_GIGMA|nr:highly derived d5-like helicase-primase: PROVISIONAL [Gigaspora margarita]